ncbi:MAG: cation:proton antiporter [Gemmatimonadota bacterium]|jgi:NhaP-type Na+/H+ or K+/H+ antiporter|nr:cation:proton antiporter [Gemmatimonadota bacterium]
MNLLVIFVVLLFVYSLVSALVERNGLTAPILFTFAGMVAVLVAPEMAVQEGDLKVFLTVAELGLVLLLFTDASHIDIRRLRSTRSLPTRLLSVGMLLTIGLGMLAAIMLFSGLSIWEAGILAAILAPTDAGLGQAIVSSPKVPKPIREALNVEAGLNDGLSVPFLLFFIVLAGAKAGVQEASLLRFFIEQFGYGVGVGLVIGVTGGRLFTLARKRDWIGKGYRQLGFVALPLLCMLASEAVGASMFIAAFVAGLAVQHGGGEDVTSHSLEFTEDWGQLINISVFFLFGVLTARQWQELDVAHFAYAALSLTVVRMVPVAIALAGSGMSRATVLFMGWFGPRGLASIVLGLVYLEHSAEHHHPTVRLAVVATVLVSILAHGLSARTGAAAYGATVARLGPNAPEVASST